MDHIFTFIPNKTRPQSDCIALICGSQPCRKIVKYSLVFGFVFVFHYLIGVEDYNTSLVIGPHPTEKPHNNMAVCVVVFQVLCFLF